MSTESNHTNVHDFMGSLAAGILEKKLSVLLSEVAQGTILHGRGSKTGKLTMELTFKQVGENSQVIITHKLSHKTPTARGSKSEDDVSETPMFVGKGGKLSETAPKEEFTGQFGLVKNG